MCRQQQPRQFRSHERGGVGRCPVDDDRFAIEAGSHCGGSARERDGPRRAVVRGFHFRRELDLSARVAAALGCLPRRPHESGPLPADHGQPVRLVVPGWCGCAWIKWVKRTAPGERSGACDEPDEGVRRTNAPDGPTRPGSRLRGARHPDGGHAHTRREETHARRPRIPDCRNRLGRIEACRSAGYPFRCRRSWKPFSICPTPTTHAVWSLWEYCGGRLSAGSTASACGSRIRRLHSVDWRPDTTCARSKLMNCSSPN